MAKGGSSRFQRLRGHFNRSPAKPIGATDATHSQDDDDLAEPTSRLNLASDPPPTSVAPEPTTTVDGEHEPTQFSHTTIPNAENKPDLARDRIYWELRLQGSKFEALARDEIVTSSPKEEDLPATQRGLSHEPARLIHVPTMTLVVGASGYKWGTWKIEEGEKLQVKGVEWDLPAIDPNRWSVSELKTLINRVAETQRVEHVWLDVACTNQGPHTAIHDAHTMLMEVQSEPLIFAGAQKCFVWIVDLSTESLNVCLRQIMYGCKLFSSASDLDLQTAAARTVVPALQQVLACEWFQSPWTLRETILCEDSILLDRNADSIPLGDTQGSEATLSILIQSCRNLMRWLKQHSSTDFVRIQTKEGIPDQELVDEALQLIESCSPFFLAACHPRTLHKITYELLTAGTCLDLDGEMIHSEEGYTIAGWGWDYRVVCKCVCDCEKQVQPTVVRRCVACVLGVSYQLGPVTIKPELVYYQEERC